MDTAGTVINAVVTIAVVMILGWLGRGRFEALGQRMGRLEDRMDAMRQELQASMESMRSDITAVALAVGARPRAENG